MDYESLWLALAICPLGDVVASCRGAGPQMNVERLYTGEDCEADATFLVKGAGCRD
jgi:hypothetical protein